MFMATPFAKFGLGEGRRHAAAVELQRALLADRVRPLEDPVLPGGQTAENLGFHRLRAGEAQIGLHAGHGVGREAGALLQHHAHLVVPVEVLVSHGDQAELGGLFAVDRLADLGLGCADGVRLAEKTGLQPRETVAHRIRAEIRLAERDRRRLAVVAFARADQHQRAVGGEGKFGQRAGKAGARLDQRDEAARRHVDALEHALKVMADLAHQPVAIGLGEEVVVIEHGLAHCRRCATARRRWRLRWRADAGWRLPVRARP